jgi:MurNAc alpha-1-phosphate uridylyltransferase
MRAMILAAGRGERMRPLTDTTPKPLLRLAGKTIIEWQIGRLRDAGVDRIIINHAWLGERIESELGDGSRFDVRIDYSPEKKALETLGGVVQALPLLGQDAFLLVSGDIYTDYDYRRASAVATSIDLTYPARCAHLVLTANPSYHATGDMGLVEGRILLEPPLLTYANIGVFHPRMFEGVARGEKLKLFPWAYRFLGEQRITGERYDGEWHNLGTPEDLMQLDRSLTERRVASSGSHLKSSYDH